MAGRRRSGLVTAMNWNGIEERIRRNRKDGKGLRNGAGGTERNEQIRRNGTERRIQEREYKEQVFTKQISKIVKQQVSRQL